MSNFDNEAQRIVSQEIRKIPGWQQTKGNSIWVCCVMPDHSERTPSLKINMDPTSKFPIGSYYCFGCGCRGVWNTLANIANLQKLREVDTQQTQAINRAKSREGVEPTLEAIVMDSWRAPLLFDVKDDYRGIKASTLNKVGVKRIYDKGAKDHALVLPVWVLGRCVGAIKARMTKDKEGRTYINSDGEWSKLRGLFPYDFVKWLLQRLCLKSIVLVEGPRDALRLIQCGIPAIAIIGAKSVSDTKIDLIMALGCRIVLCMDSDKAGVTATNTLRRMLKGKCECTYFPLKKYAKEESLRIGEEVEYDPANMPMELVRKLKEML